MPCVLCGDGQHGWRRFNLSFELFFQRLKRLNERAATPCLLAGKIKYHSSPAAALQWFGHHETKSLGCGLVGVESPEVDDKLPGESHGDPFFAGTSLLAELPSDFFQAYPFGLELDEPPDGFNQEFSQPWVAVFVDGALPAFAAAAVFAWAKSRVAGDLPAVAKSVPVADLPADVFVSHRSETFGKESRCLLMELLLNVIAFALNDQKALAIGFHEFG